jgi:hypothetical protein
MEIALHTKMADIISSEEFGSTVNTGKATQYHTESEAPLSLSKSTSTSVGQQTAWRPKKGAALSRQTSGSTLNFDAADAATPLPKSDTGANFLKG